MPGEAHGFESVEVVTSAPYDALLDEFWATCALTHGGPPLTPQRRHSVSPSEAPPLAPLPLRTLQALDPYIHPWVVYRPPRFRPEEGENLVRRDDMEMVDVGLPQTDSKEGLLDADAPEGGEAKAMV